MARSYHMGIPEHNGQILSITARSHFPVRCSARPWQAAMQAAMPGAMTIACCRVDWQRA